MICIDYKQSVPWRDGKQEIDHNEILALSVAFRIPFPLWQRQWNTGPEWVFVVLLSVSCLDYLGLPKGIQGPAHTHLQQEQLRVRELWLLRAASGQNQHPPARRLHGRPHYG